MSQMLYMVIKITHQLIETLNAQLEWVSSTEPTLKLPNYLRVFLSFPVILKKSRIIKQNK